MEQQEEEAQEATEATDIATWKQAVKARALTLPSGNVALVKRKGLQMFVTQGRIPNGLMPLVTDAINTGQAVPAAKLSAMASDMSMLADAMEMMDSIVLECVVKPLLSPVPKWTARDAADGNCGDSQIGEVKPESERNPDALYIDELDIEDKSFVFQYIVGGTSNLERFRIEQSSVMADVVDGAEVPSST